MGMVTFVDRTTGETVDAEFPLNESTVAFQKGNGWEQFPRADFDAAYAQKLPELPAVSTTNIPELEGVDQVPLAAPAPEVYTPPSVKTILPPAVVSHIDVSWFVELDNKIAALGAKLDAVLAKLEQTAAVASEASKS